MRCYSRPFALVLAGLAVLAPVASAVEGRIPVSSMSTPVVTSLPTSTSTPFPTPSPTPSVEDRLARLEWKADQLEKDVGASLFKEIVEIIQAITTVIAIIVGGGSSYWLFVRNRQKYPRASVAHHIAHKRIGDDRLLLHVGVTAINEGDVLLELVSLETRVQQVLPLSGEILAAIAKGQRPVPEGQTEMPWPQIDSQKLVLEKGDEWEVEPGESQDIHHDFILDGDIEVVEVYTYLMNETKRKRELAWDLTSLYDLTEENRTMPEKDRGRKQRKPKPGGQRRPKKPPKEPPKKPPKEDE